MNADERTDPVERLVRDASGEEMAEWMVKYHGLKPSSAETVASNLREQFKWHRLQGRLDQKPTAAVIAEIFLMRRSPLTLKTPEKTKEA